jgi:hypothetical protein
VKCFEAIRVTKKMIDFAEKVIGTANVLFTCHAVDFRLKTLEEFLAPPPLCCLDILPFSFLLLTKCGWRL